MRFYLLRHAQSANNARSKDDQVLFSGRQPDPEITSLGADQARAAGEYLKREVNENPMVEEHDKITHMYCSPMKRALQTAQHVQEALGVACDVVRDLHEQGGLFEGKRPAIVKNSRSEQPNAVKGITSEGLKTEFPFVRLLPAESSKGNGDSSEEGGLGESPGSGSGGSSEGGFGAAFGDVDTVGVGAVGPDGWWGGGFETYEECRARAKRVAVWLWSLASFHCSAFSESKEKFKLKRKAKDKAGAAGAASSASSSPPAAAAGEGGSLCAPSPATQQDPSTPLPHAHLLIMHGLFQDLLLKELLRMPPLVQTSPLAVEFHSSHNSWDFAYFPIENAGLSVIELRVLGDTEVAPPSLIEAKPILRTLSGGSLMASGEDEEEGGAQKGKRGGGHMGKEGEGEGGSKEKKRRAEGGEDEDPPCTGARDWQAPNRVCALVYFNDVHFLPPALRTGHSLGPVVI